jgi:hypothetical protein
VNTVGVFLVKLFPLYTILCLLFLGCAGSPTTWVSPYSWDDPYWKAQNYENKDPESVIVTEGDLERKYREVATIYTEGSPKDKGEAFNLMRSRLSEFGADAVIKVRKKKNKNYEGIVVLFD